MSSIILNPVSNAIHTSTQLTGNEKLVTIGPHGQPSTVSVDSILNKVDDSIADRVEDQVMDQILESVDEKVDDLLDDKIDEALDLSNYFTKEQVNTVIETSVGNLATLTTTNKENVVAAINEVKGSIKNDNTLIPLYSDPNLDFEATSNNVDSYGYVGTLQNINVNGDLILIDSLAVYVREGKSSPNLNTPVWCRLLKFVDGNWEIIYQSTESKSIRDIAPETLFSFKMKAANEQNKLIKYNDKIAIVYVDAEDAPIISSIQLGFKAILGIGGGIQNQFVNESTGVSNWAPAFVIGYLSMADTPTNFVTIENSQTITGTKQFNNGINISGKTFITSAIDGGELKVLHNNSSKGFIVRTVNGSDDILPLELLSTNGLDSYKYTFPTKSGDVVLNSNIGDGLTITDGVVNCNSTTIKMTDNVTIEDTIQSLLNRIEVLEQSIQDKSESVVENGNLNFSNGANVESSTLKLTNGRVEGKKLIL